MPHAVPSVSWAQKSSETTAQLEDNAIRLSVSIPDIATSCLKCTTVVVGKTVSFRAYPRENETEARYGFDLALYSEVDSERMVVKQDLPTKCLVITLPKKDKSAQDWPRLQENEQVPPYISKDLGPWTSESIKDQSHSQQMNIDLRHFTTAEYFESRGSFFFQKFQRFGQIQDIENSVINFEEAVKRTPDEHEEMADRLNSLGGALIMRFDCLGKVEDITKAILKLEDAVRLTHEGDPNLPNIFSNLGIAYSSRFERTDDLHDVDRAILYQRKTVDTTPWDPDNHPIWIKNLALTHLSRFHLTKNIEDLEIVISHFKNMADSYPPGHEDIPGLLNNLGDLYRHRFNCTQDIQDIDSVIAHHQKAVDCVPANHASLWESFNNLVVAYIQRFVVLGSSQDIESAISFGHKAVDCSPSDGEGRLKSLSNLAISYLSRFEKKGNLQDLDFGITYRKQMVELTSSKDGALSSRFHDLGDSYVTRFEQTGDLQDIESAISYHQRAVDSASSGHSGLPSWLNRLGHSYTRRFERSGDLQDIELAISCNQKAINCITSGHKGLSELYDGLGHSYGRRFEHTGDLRDIDSAVSYHRKAIESSSSKTNASLYANLGNSYLLRFNRTGNLKDINSAISYHTKAVESASSGHTNLPAYFNNLGRSYLSRFERIGDLQDNDYALMYNQKSIEVTPSGHAELTRRIHNLGDAHLSRFMVTGDLHDIDLAISYHQKAVDSMPSDHADLPTQFCGLGYAYRSRFEHTGDLQDINQSISYHQKAVDSTPSDHTEILSRLNLLANAYDTRFRHSRDLHDIESALSLHHKVVDSAPPVHSNLPNWLNNLGTSYEMRFEHTLDLRDIDTAISFITKALDSAPSDHTSRGAWFSNLGNSYGLRFKQTDSIDDIDLSISYFQQGAALTPLDHSHLTNLLRSLGTSYACRFKHSNSDSDMQAAISSYSQGANAPGTPSARLESATNAALLSFDHDRSRCLDDFSLVINLLSEVAGLEQTIHRRHSNLQGRSKFIRAAAGAALEFGRLDLALEWLEQGRCLVWNQINQLRTPIDDLREQSPSLADKFMNLARALESHGTREVSAVTLSDESLTDDILLQDQTLDHTRLAGQYKQILSEIRNLKNFDNFLRPTKAIDILSSLPPDGPVIIFNIFKSQCDALALISGTDTPLHIPLEDFDISQADKLRKILQFDVLDKREAEDQNRATRRRREHPESMSFILKDLWLKVVFPILKALAYVVPDDPSKRSRIWWCPTGPLAFLPLHAAGIYGSEYRLGSRALDYVVSSYTPSVRSITENFSMSPGPSKSTRILLISQPNTPGFNPIPSARTETHDIRALMDRADVNALLLEDTAATRETVTKEIKTHNWVHFACHGVQDRRQALASGLCLHDGRLELLEIIKQRIPSPDLAFLSACQTSKGDNELSEEVVHLAAGMLSAGYRGVVSTMWNISDVYGPKFATEFYQYLLSHKKSDGLDGTQAAFALDYATTKVRECLGDDESAFLTWVPYVHFGY